MFPRFQATLRVVLGFLLLGLLPSMVLADSWGARRDIGVAAVDRKTGKVQWEAWQRDDVPDGFSKAGKAAVERLLPDSKRNPEFRWPDLPAALGKDRVVDYVNGDESGPYFVLSHGQPNAIGAEIARFPWGDDDARWRCEIFGGTLYCLRDTQVQAYVGTMNEEPKDKKWEPAWTFDLLAGLPEQVRRIAEFIPMEMHVNREGVWVVHGPRILQLTPEGRLQSQYKLKRLNGTWFDHYVGTPLTFGKHLIYYRSTCEVIALDWQKKREVWRLSTTLAPNVSRVVEIEENLVLVQIGSDVPRTIQKALENNDELRKKSPKSTRERMAAARLLHSYGDGYLRKQLREYREKLRKRENDAEAKQAVAVLDDLLGTWPRKRDRQRLIDAAVAALLKAEEKAPQQVFASPANERLLIWDLLQGLIYGGISPNQPNFNDLDENRLFLDGIVAAKLTDHCRQVIAKGPDAEKSFAASVLVSRTVGWYRLSDDERKKLFLSPQASVWPWAAMSLIRNGWRDELIQWAPKRPASDHTDIVWMLADKMPKKWSKAELDFWLTSARREPGRVAYVLNLCCEGEIPVAFRAPIRSYLEKEIAKPTVKDIGNEEASYLFAAVYVLDRWKNPDDTPLLLKYLKHPCIRLRGHVKDMLEKRGVKPPPGIVYEEDGGQEKK